MNSPSSHPKHVLSLDEINKLKNAKNNVGIYNNNLKETVERETHENHTHLNVEKKNDHSMVFEDVVKPASRRSARPDLNEIIEKQLSIENDDIYLQDKLTERSRSTQAIISFVYPHKLFGK